MRGSDPAGEHTARGRGRLWDGCRRGAWRRRAPSRGEREGCCGTLSALRRCPRATLHRAGCVSCRLKSSETEMPPDHHRRHADRVGRILRAQSTTDRDAVRFSSGRSSSGSCSGWLEGRLKNAPRTARAPWRTAHEIPSAGNTSPQHGLRWTDAIRAAACTRSRIRRAVA